MPVHQAAPDNRTPCRATDGVVLIVLRETTSTEDDMRTAKPHTRFGIALLAVGALTVAGCSAAGPAAGAARSSVETPIPSVPSVPTVAATAAPDTIASDVPVAVATATRSSGAADVGRRLITRPGGG